MDIHPIRTTAHHTEALREIERLWGAEPNTPEGERLDLLLDLVEHYEEKNFPIHEVEPVEIIKAHMEATGRTQADLADVLGSRPRASEILNRRRALTVSMIHKLHAQWGLPSDCLVRPYHLEPHDSA